MQIEAALILSLQSRVPSGWHAGLGFVKDVDDLRFRETVSFHVASPVNILPEESTFGWYYFRGGLPILFARDLHAHCFRTKNQSQ